MSPIRFAPQVATLALLLAAIAMPAGRAAATDLYKWTDKNGVVHYSDTLPTAAGAQRLRLHDSESPTPAPESAPAEAAATPAKPADAPLPATLPDTPENRQRVCEQSRSALELLQSKFQIADASGKPLDAKSRAQRTITAQQDVARNCQSAQ